MSSSADQGDNNSRCEGDRLIVSSVMRQSHLACDARNRRESAQVIQPSKDFKVRKSNFDLQDTEMHSS